MKKFLSILVVMALVFSTMAIAVFATTSPTGKITYVGEESPVVVDKDGKEKADVDTSGALVELEHHDDEKDYVPAAEEYVEAFGDKYEGFKLYGSFEFKLTEHGKEQVGDGELKGVSVTVNVPGVEAANNPTVFYYDVENDTYVICETKVNGSELTFEAMPLSAAEGENIGYYGVIYTGSVTSPSTGVPTVAFVVILVVALAGAAFAGKKVFAK